MRETIDMRGIVDGVGLRGDLVWLVRMLVRRGSSRWEVLRSEGCWPGVLAEIIGNEHSKSMFRKLGERELLPGPLLTSFSASIPRELWQGTLTTSIHRELWHDF